MEMRQERATLSDNELQLLEHISRQLGWSKSQVLRVAFFEPCSRLGLMDRVLQKKPLTEALSKETRKNLGT